MHPSPSRGRSAIALVAALALSGCAATTPPSALSASPSSSLPVPSASPSVSASVAPLPSESAASVDPTAEPQPTPTPDESNPPEPTPAPVKPIAGCGTGEAGFAAHNAEIPETFQFGHATLEFASAGVGMRDGSWEVDDVIPGGVGLTANEIGVVVAPGDHIILRADGLTLLDTSAVASPWSEVTFEGGLAALGGARTELAWRIRNDGSLSISAPDAIGDWAVEFFPRWRGDCLKGDGTVYARIKVR